MTRPPVPPQAITAEARAAAMEAFAKVYNDPLTMAACLDAALEAAEPHLTEQARAEVENLRHALKEAGKEMDRRYEMGAEAERERLRRLLGEHKEVLATPVDGHLMDAVRWSRLLDVLAFSGHLAAADHAPDPVDAVRRERERILAQAGKLKRTFQGVARDVISYGDLANLLREQP